MLELTENTLSTYFADMARRMADYLIERQADPEYMSQNRAYKTFGRATVERWKNMNLITPRITTGRMEYKTSILRKLQDIKQDYFSVPTSEQKRIAKGK